jgi:hypothetical protein
MISQTIQPGPERAAARSRAAQLARPVRATTSLPEPTITTAKKQPAKRTG